MVAAAPQRSGYGRTIAWLGGSALVAVLIGLVFTPISRALFSEELQGEVIVLAIPFVGYFAAIILLFILAVALIGQRFHQTVPARTHRPVEFVAIAGILIGIIALFQPWNLAPYRYGFNVLLYATLGFILWSHVAPRGAGEDAGLPPFTPRATGAAVLVAVAVVALVFGPLAVSARPVEPYGLRQRRWESLREEQKLEVIAGARRDHRFVTLPVLLLFSTLPGLATFFVLREVITPKSGAEPAAAAEDAPVVS